MKANHKKIDKKANADQAALLQRAEQAETKLEAALQELSRSASRQSPRGLHPKAKGDLHLHRAAVYREHADDEGSDGQQGANHVYQDYVGCLSMLPPQVEELKRSAAHKGAFTTLSRCLAYALELKPEEVAAGYPELKDDESEFTEDDYHRVVKESRATATHLAAG
ncbi:hypothetical protein ZWY2020_034521 [Hordeum vulgare]|nr:hypothetical protein ZWY2020_034521 [Hordeum vulgare]